MIFLQVQVKTHLSEHFSKWMIHLERTFLVVKNLDLINLQVAFDSQNLSKKSSRILSKNERVLKMTADASRYTSATYNKLGDYLRISCKQMNC